MIQRPMLLHQENKVVSSLKNDGEKILGHWYASGLAITKKTKEVFMKTFIAAFGLALASGAMAQGQDLSSKKQLMNQYYDQKISRLQEAQACINAAQTEAAVRDCKQEAREEMQEAKQDFKQQKKDSGFNRGGMEAQEEGFSSGKTRNEIEGGESEAAE
jgi:hypothetical protein